MSLDTLRDEILGYGSHDPGWYRKMVHPIPEAKVVNRVQFLCDQSRDKVVLHLGSDGPLHAMIEKVAKKVYGIDLTNTCGAKHFIETDLDRLSTHRLALSTDLDLILCPEILEHLGNPGLLLEHLRETRLPLLITVPNAFSSSGYHSVQEGTEMVNAAHVAWYSWHTLKGLVERYGYTVQEFYWYNGQARTAEGIIFVVR